MADVKDLMPDLDRLDGQIDDLEENLQPLLDNLQEMSSQLPLLDKAKLFSLTAYSIETLLFSSLKLEGADAQNHAVFAELKRIQQYFAKIKAAEEPEETRTLTVDQQAATRLIKSGLSDRKDISSKLAEKLAAERAQALLKSMDSKKRFADDSAPASGDSASESKKPKKHKDGSKSKNKGSKKNKSSS